MMKCSRAAFENCPFRHKCGEEAEFAEGSECELFNREMGKSELQYPNMRADVELCRKQLYALCRGERGPTAVMSVPPQETDFDMQFSAAFDELESARACVSQLDEVKRRINQAYWAAWAGDFQEPGTPENERLHAALQDVMLALKGQEHTRPERAEAVKTAEKELARAERSLDGAKKREAPACDIENLEKKVAYKRLVLELIRMG